MKRMIDQTQATVMWGLEQGQTYFTGVQKLIKSVNWTCRQTFESMNIIVFIVVFYSLFFSSDFLTDCDVHLFILACKHFTKSFLMAILNPCPQLNMHSYSPEKLMWTPCSFWTCQVKITLVQWSLSQVQALCPQRWVIHNKM